MSTDSDACHDASATARFVVGPDFCVRSWDTSMQRLTGIRADEVVGALVGERLPALLEGDWFEALQGALFGGSTDAVAVPKVGLPLKEVDAVSSVTVAPARAPGVGAVVTAVLDAPDRDSVDEATAAVVASIQARMVELGVGDDAEGLELVLGDFLSTAAELSASLDAAVDARDAAMVERIAHRFAGASLTLGDQGLGAHFARLERTAARGDADAFHALNVAAQEGLDLAVAACRTLITNSAAPEFPAA